MDWVARMMDDLSSCIMTTYHLNRKPTGWLLFKGDLPDIIQDYRYNTRDEAIYLAETFLLSLKEPVKLRIRDIPSVHIEERFLNAPQLE